MVAIHNRSILREDVRKISNGLFDVNCSFQRTPLETLAQTMDCNKHKMLKVWCLPSASGWHLDRLQAKTMDIAVGKSHRLIQRHYVDAIQQDETPLPCCDSEIPDENSARAVSKVPSASTDIAILADAIKRKKDVCPTKLLQVRSQSAKLLEALAHARWQSAAPCGRPCSCIVVANGPRLRVRLPPMYATHLLTETVMQREPYSNKLAARPLEVRRDIGVRGVRLRPPEQTCTTAAFNLMCRR